MFKGKSDQMLLPRRQSLIEECTRLLREAIFAGHWNESLPGERELSEQMKISRPTLRVALSRLERDGVVARDGRRRRLISKQSHKSSVARHVISLLSPLEISAMQEHELIWLSELRRILSRYGYELKIQVRPSLFKNRICRSIENIRQDAVTACWILYRSNVAVQKWFAQHLPQSIVAGSTYADVKLSSVDIDNRAVCRHAVGTLLRNGHTVICYVGSRSRHAGDVHSEEGFEESFRHLDPGNYYHCFARHDGTPESLTRALDGILLLKVRPTAFIVANSNHTLTTLTYLARKRLIAGRDYALIARDDAPFFHHVSPSIARYSNMPGRIAQELASLAIRQAETFTGAILCKRIMSNFIPGASLIAREMAAP